MMRRAERIVLQAQRLTEDVDLLQMKVRIALAQLKAIRRKMAVERHKLGVKAPEDPSQCASA
jgi:hypothetical protein